MNYDSYIKEIQAFFKKHARPDIITKYTKYFKEGYDAYGIDVITYETQRDVWFEAWEKKLSYNQFLELSDELFKTGKYEEGSLAVAFTIKNKKNLDIQAFEHAGLWLEQNVQNWAHADYIAGDLVFVLYKKNIIGMNELKSWRESASKWKRRAVPVSLIKPMKAYGFEESMLEMLNPLMTDTGRVVHQGLGWFLREAWKKDNIAVEDYLYEWKDDAARLIFQYATEKMNPIHRARFKKSRK
jgi:3-methyladenine DNA glycosylase AlkD